jgi:hypothetical protein
MILVFFTPRARRPGPACPKLRCAAPPRPSSESIAKRDDGNSWLRGRTMHGPQRQLAALQRRGPLTWSYCTATNGTWSTKTQTWIRQRLRHDALAEAKQCIEQKKVLQEECDKLHHSLKEAQERTVDLHRSTLDELRRRDSEGRDIAEKQRVEWSSLRVQAEMTSQENRCLKRRLDECLEIEQESKRLRNNYKQLEVEHAKNETAKELLQQQLEAVRNENESLRRNNSEIESRLAVSEATSKLDTCRRSFL